MQPRPSASGTSLSETSSSSRLAQESQPIALSSPPLMISRSKNQMRMPKRISHLSCPTIWRVTAKTHSSRLTALSLLDLAKLLCAALEKTAPEITKKPARETWKLIRLCKRSLKTSPGISLPWDSTVQSLYSSFSSSACSSKSLHPIRRVIKRPSISS